MFMRAECPRRSRSCCKYRLDGATRAPQDSNSPSPCRHADWQPIDQLLRVGRARHPVRISDAVPEELVRPRPAMTGPSVAAVVCADNLSTDVAAVRDVVEQRSRGPPVMVDKFFIRDFFAFCEEVPEIDDPER